MEPLPALAGPSNEGVALSHDYALNGWKTAIILENSILGVGQYEPFGGRISVIHAIQHTKRHKVSLDLLKTSNLMALTAWPSGI